MADEETDAQRIAREDRAAEAIGLDWQRRSDEFLVGYVDGQRPGRFHTPAIVEMERRLGAAVRAAGRSADVQAAETLTLNKRLLWLTVATTVLALVQAVSAVWSIIQNTQK